MPRRVYLETFGCQMNELDSELVTGQLHALGYRFTPRPDEADVVLYNTCSVREHAEQKVWSRLGELAIRKRSDPGLVVGVLGCMAERDGVDLIRRMPVVDVLVGPAELDKLPTLLDNALRTRESLIAEAPDHAPARSARQVALQGDASRRTVTLAAAEDSLEFLDLSRAVSPIDGSARHSAYVRITRGCNKFCTYCVVPFTRGAEIHRPPDHILEECRRLADAGVREITLLGQTVNHYRFEHGAAVSVRGVTQPQKGRAFKGGHARDPLAGVSVTTFADLLARIHERVPALSRLRFVTSYPRDFGDDALDAIRDHPRICRYLHVPAQSGSDRLLKLMNRGYSAPEYLDFIDRARARLDQPEIGRPLMISGDFIVGFPTETDDDFAATVALLRRARYKNAFIFKYSPRPGTVAFDKLADDVPESVKRRRNNELLALQSDISDEISRAQVGRTLDVFVEGPSKHETKRRARRAEAREPLPPHSPPAHPRAHAGLVGLTICGRADPTTDPDHCSHGAACSTVASHRSHPHADTPHTHGPVQLVGRTDGDLIVHFQAPAGAAPESWIGRTVPVQIEAADRLSLHGTAAAG
ncbi:MAG: MiaB/RimO family radical SAM methylthiotransferase [Phycisphaerae bacterium]|nr:MiaB/RimO family radical SAM methylthiotransferase [Phycisphaerae bacterium]